MRLPVILIGEENLALASLRQHFAKEAGFLVEQKARDFDDAKEALRKKTGPALVVIDNSRDTDQILQLAEDFKLQFPTAHLLMTSSDDSPQAILQAMRAGAEEFLGQPFNWSEVAHCLEKIRQRIVLRWTHEKEHGSIITVFSSKGGVGATTVATNLAVSLAARQRSTCIIDLVLQFGAVTSAFDLEASYTILDLVKNLQRMDPLLLEGSLVQHASGVRVVAEPFHAEEASRLLPEDIDHTLDTLAQAFDFVVVDAPKEVDEVALPALEKAHLVLFVAEMNIPFIKSAHRALESFGRLGIPHHKMRLVLNRYVPNKLLTREAVEKTLGLKVFHTLPNDYPTAVSALNQGMPLLQNSPKSKLAKGYQGLATAVLEELAATDGKLTGTDKKPGLFSRWLPLRKAS